MTNQTNRVTSNDAQVRPDGATAPVVVPLRVVCARAAVEAVAVLGTKAAAAGALGIHVRTLYRLLHSAGVVPKPGARVAPMLAARERKRQSDRIGTHITWSGWL